MSDIPDPFGTKIKLDIVEQYQEQQREYAQSTRDDLPTKIFAIILAIVLVAGAAAWIWHAARPSTGSG